MAQAYGSLQDLPGAGSFGRPAQGPYYTALVESHLSEQRFLLPVD